MTNVDSDAQRQQRSALFGKPVAPIFTRLLPLHGHLVAMDVEGAGDRLLGGSGADQFAFDRPVKEHQHPVAEPISSS
jgi:hypothetical protein